MIDTDKGDRASRQVPHDLYFKKMMSHLRFGTEILRRVMPPKVLATIDLARGRQVSESLISDRLKERRGDVIYEFPHIGGDGSLSVGICFEHKSNPDNMVYRQVTVYRILIPQVLHGTAVATYSIILYHGEKPWEIPLQHIDLLDPATRSEVSALYDAGDRHCLVFNLNAPEGSSQRIEIEGFSKEVTLFLHVLTEIWCLKERKNRHRLIRLLKELGQISPETHFGRMLIRATIEYIVSYTGYSRGEIERIWEKHLPKEVSKVMVSTIDQIYNEGIAKGEQIGKETMESTIDQIYNEGIAKGEQIGKETMESTIDQIYNEGIAKGVQVGRSEGVQVGIEKGERIGRVEGVQIEVERIAINMIRSGMDNDLIGMITALSAAEIERLRKTHND